MSKALFLLVLALTGVSQAAESAKGQHVRVSWLAPQTFGTTETHVGLFFDVDPGWHVYWRNPGDSGAAPKFHLQAEGASLGPVLWPYPSRLPVGDLVNLGYEGDVVYPMTLSPSADDVRIRARLEWLVCKEECIPGFATLELRRKAGAARDVWRPQDEIRLRQFLARVPEAAGRAPWNFSVKANAGGAVFVSVTGQASDLEKLDLFPLQGDAILATPPIWMTTSTGVDYEFKPFVGNALPQTLSFVAVAGNRAWETGPLPVTMAAIESEEAFDFLPLLGLAFLGGLLLNLMPCVFPVLSIKVFSLTKSGHSLREGLLYGAGAVVTFMALGAGLLVLRAAGSSVGWGFQLQSPSVILGLALLFWLMALNFLGVFEFGDSIMNMAGRRATASSFGTGVLSVFVAAPCTGPFMGTALGAAVTLDAASALMLFGSLGAGLASPVVLFAAVPRAMAFLPKPGAWMERFKQFLSFPLFATVLWLLWVLGRQLGDQGWLVGGTLLLATAFALWVGRGRGKGSLVFAWMIAIVAVGAGFSALQAAPTLTAEAPSASSSWIAYDEGKLAEARAQGRPVFVDFTAAWCITCQWNKKSVLETGAAEKAFARGNTLLLRADWTNYDEKITKALAVFGRSSVPVYAFYPAGGGAPRLLPQILTISMIEDLFSISKEVQE